MACTITSNQFLQLIAVIATAVAAAAVVLAEIFLGMNE
jgi:hypothetical protein